MYTSITGFEFSDGYYEEFLPSSNQAQTVFAQRAIFFSLYNFYMPKYLRFIQKEIDTRKNIYQNFISKILNTFPLSFTKPYKKYNTFKIDIIATATINNFMPYLMHPKISYISKHNPKSHTKFYAKEPRLYLAKLINVIYKGGRRCLNLDLDEAFSNLVFERIKHMNKDKNVVLFDEGIWIEQEHQSTFVFPYFKNFDLQKLHSYEEIQIAQKKIQQNKPTLIYLVYPKSETFTKHIEIKLPQINKNEDEYKVKLIPYSFSFCLKNNKGKNLCK